MITITGGGALTRQNLSDINANFAEAGAPFTPGRLIYCNPATPVDVNIQDGSEAKPYQTLATAYGAARNAMNDIVILVGNGNTTGTARVNASFTWAKDATHLFGVCSPVQLSQRARIAPTGSTTAFTPFFTVSGNGCIFQNISWFYGFTVGTATEILMVLTGSRNYFGNCHLAGMADTDHASADGAGSRILKIGAGGSGENVFERCTLGVDTTTRSAANATIEFTAATTRNIFRECIFPFQTSAATPLGFIGTGTENMDRWQLFDNCNFINNVKSTSTAMDGLGTLAASSGGLLLFKQSVLVGITEYGTDATTRNQCYVDGLTGAAATSGIAVNPS